MNEGEIRLDRWPSKKAPDEARILEIFSAEELAPYRWSNGPGDEYGAHSHPYRKIVFVVRGTIEFRVAMQREPIELRAGDRLELPANMRHAATVGSGGVVCLEAHC
jgi:quercetin dioxygenase-like cupin family protein